MPRSTKLETQLADLEAAQQQLPSAEAIALVGQGLASKHAVVIAKAAKLMSDHHLAQFVPELVATFDRLLVNPVKTDQACLGKTAIADALYHLDYSDETLFLQGIHHIQLEPVWGGKQDTAVALRGICALGLVRMNYPAVMSELADLLADPEAQARVAAVKAIAYSGNPQGVPLLRLKTRIVDANPAVVAECLDALIALAPAASFDLVASFLNHPDDILQETAALALGASRLLAALPLLQQWWQRQTNPDLRATALLSIFNLRQAESLDFLLALVSEGKPSQAKESIAVLSVPKDPALWQQVCERVEQRDHPELKAAVQSAWR